MGRVRPGALGESLRLMTENTVSILARGPYGLRGNVTDFFSKAAVATGIATRAKGRSPISGIPPPAPSETPHVPPCRPSQIQLCPGCQQSYLRVVLSDLWQRKDLRESWERRAFTKEG